jgi:hypothetical protein
VGFAACSIEPSPATVSPAARLAAPAAGGSLRRLMLDTLHRYPLLLVLLLNGRRLDLRRTLDLNLPLLNPLLNRLLVLQLDLMLVLLLRDH